jgi:hypothetical protein
MLVEFRGMVRSDVKIIQFLSHRHYTCACAHGLSLARGDQVILISHDMIVTPDYLRTLLAVAASDPQLGIIRGSSPHMDCSPNRIAPAFGLPTIAAVEEFSTYIAKTNGLSVVDEIICVGDSMLIQRPVLESIGVFDERFVGFLGDCDYGIRARRAGFRIVTARGAWLLHYGGGTVAADVGTGRTQPQNVKDGMNQLDRAYPNILPPTFAQLRGEHLQALQTAPAPAGGEFVPQVKIDPGFCKVL